MDNLIIEHLACLEINRLILQKPFHLISEIQMNDKTPSYDGSIVVYESEVLSRDNIKGSVKVQIKGTTQNKIVEKHTSIKYPINKIDLDVYKKSGEGVLYLVVFIDKVSNQMQAYYKSITPLEVYMLVDQFNKTKQSSKRIIFKRIEEGSLEHICNFHLNNVKKQPNNYIDLSRNRNFDEYKLVYNVLENERDRFDIFGEVGFVYGVSDGIDFPVRALVADSYEVEEQETINIAGETIGVKYTFIETGRNINLVIENSLEVFFDKKSTAGNFKVTRLVTLKSYIKICKILIYILKKEYLPIKLFRLQMIIKDKETTEKIIEELSTFEDLLEIFNAIGIPEEYEFNKNEDIEKIFSGIDKVFGRREYEYLTYDSIGDKESSQILNVKISTRINLLLYKDEKNNRYYNMFSENIFNKVGAYITLDKIDTKDNFNKVSIYFNYNFKKELLNLTNFNFEVYKESFKEVRHLRSLIENNQKALDLISAYDLVGNIEYLDLAKELLEDLVRIHIGKNAIYKVNLIQIKKRVNGKLDYSDEIYLHDLLDNTDDNQFKFVINILLHIKIGADKILNTFSEEVKSQMFEWPIFHLYNELSEKPLSKN